MTSAQVDVFQASDGYPIHFRRWDAQGEVRGIILALHGIQSHSGWYHWSSEFLAQNGYHVWAADRRGSGLNGRNRGHAEHGEQLINDLRALRIRALRSCGSQLPVSLMGVSWGGRLAAASAVMYPAEFERVVLLYPGIVTVQGPTRLQRLRLRLARHLQIVRDFIPIPLTSQLFTGIPDWQQFIDDDPLSLRTVTSSFLNAGSDLDAILQDDSATILAPVKLILAGRDQIVDNPATEQLTRRISPRISVDYWPDACHTLEFEPQRGEIFSHLLNWLNTAQ